MGLAVGTRAIIVETGYGRTEAPNRPADIPEIPVVANLMEAVSLVVGSRGDVRAR
jgi:hypothetical protein